LSALILFGLERRDVAAAGAVIASGAKQSISPQAEKWIASSLTLLAMTWMEYHRNSTEFNDVAGNGLGDPLRHGRA
jgi:hypothetical protein